MYVFNPHKVFQYFRNNFVLGKRSPKGWYSMNCAFCNGANKMALSVEWQIVKCWKCGAKCNIAEFVESVENCSYYEAKEIVNSITVSPLDMSMLEEIEDIIDVSARVNVTLPDGWKSITDGTGPLGVKARSYLANRGFSIEELDYKGFGYCTKHHEELNKDFYGYIIVPFRKDGSLAYYIGRNFLSESMRYKNPPSDWVGVGKADVIYNEEALHLYKTITITEGWSDAQAIGNKGTATLGWNMSPRQRDKYLKSTASKIIFIPDAGNATNGQSYYQVAVNTATTFLDKSKDIVVLDLNVPQLSEHGKDVCEIGWNRIKTFYKHAEPLNWNTAMNIITS